MPDWSEALYDDLTPDEICDIALDNMRLMERSVVVRCRMQDSWQFTLNAARLAAYEGKRKVRCDG